MGNNIGRNVVSSFGSSWPRCFGLEIVWRVLGLVHDRFECQDKAIGGVLVPWPVGLGMPKRHLEGLRAGKRQV